MLELNIRLCTNGSSGATAMIENTDGDSIEIYYNENISGKDACLIAAERLQAAAKRFAKLSRKPDIFKRMTQDNINVE